MSFYYSVIHFIKLTLCLDFQRPTTMPFMKGVAPIRRTTKYLTNCPLVFKPRVKIMTINFNDEETEKHHSGARDFVFWNLPQVQYRNPDLQIVTFRNLTPSPFITCFLEDSGKVYFDVDSQSNKEIMDRLVTTLGKSQEVSPPPAPLLFLFVQFFQLFHISALVFMPRCFFRPLFFSLLFFIRSSPSFFPLLSRYQLYSFTHPLFCSSSFILSRLHSASNSLSFSI